MPYDNTTPHHSRNHGTGTMPSGSDPASVSGPKLRERLVLETEAGSRETTRCCLPNINAYHSQRFALERKLCETFGGFTSYAMRGGWVDGDSQMMIEYGLIYEVSYPVRDAKTKAPLAREIFCHAGRDIGEQWVHVERHRFDAAHARVL